MQLETQLFCEKHDRRKINLACTNLHCKEQRPCCFFCLQQKHSEHVDDVKEIETVSLDMKEELQIKRKFLTQIDELQQKVNQCLNNIKAYFKLESLESEMFDQLTISKLHEKIQLLIENTLGKYSLKISKIEQFLNGMNREFDSLTIVLANEQKEDNIQSAQEKIKQNLYYLSTLTEEHKYEEALQHIEEQLVINPNNRQILLYKAYVLANKNKLQEALSIYYHLEQQDPTDSRLVFYICNVLIDAKQFQQALEKCQMILLIQPDNTQMLMIKGECLMNLERFDEALDSYLEADQLKETERGKFQIGKILKKFGDIKGSMNYLEQAVLYGEEFENEISTLLDELRSQL